LKKNKKGGSGGGTGAWVDPSRLNYWRVRAPRGPGVGDGGKLTELSYHALTPDEKKEVNNFAYIEHNLTQMGYSKEERKLLKENIQDKNSTRFVADLTEHAVKKLMAEVGLSAPPRAGKVLIRPTNKSLAASPAVSDVVSPGATVSDAGSPGAGSGDSIPACLMDGWTEAESCDICGKDFTLFSRRHHCRFCRKSMHASCGAKTKICKMASGEDVPSYACSDCLG